MEKKITKTFSQRWKRLSRKRYCEPTLVASGQFSSESYEDKKKRNSPGTKMIKKSNASFRAARNMLKQMKELIVM